jgi:hypothetical protein
MLDARPPSPIRQLFKTSYHLVQAAVWHHSSQAAIPLRFARIYQIYPVFVHTTIMEDTHLEKEH